MTQKNHHTARNTRQSHTNTLIFSLLTLLVVSIGCKKDKPAPTPVDAQSLVGTTWRQIGDFPDDYSYALIFTFLTDSTFDFSLLKNGQSKPLIRTETWSDGISRTDTLGLGITRYIFDYKDGKGNLICKWSNYNAVWLGSENGLIHRVKLDKLEGTIATFTIDNNVLKITYIDTSEVNSNVGLHPAPAPIQLRKK